MQARTPQDEKKKELENFLKKIVEDTKALPIYKPFQAQPFIYSPYGELLEKKVEPPCIAQSDSKPAPSPPKFFKTKEEENRCKWMELLSRITSLKGFLSPGG